jgi:protein tyrosine/serine phosphatase
MDQAIPSPELARALASHPFVPLEGSFNTRTLSTPGYVQAGLIYRSGSLAGLTQKGQEQLVRGLNVRTIFDLRSGGEKKAFPLPSLEQEHGVRIASVTSDSPPAAMDLTDFVPRPNNPALWNGGAHGFSKSYLEILAIYQTAFREVFSHLIENPGSPILFNCTAGKDRTGTLAALIQAVAGVPDNEIANDYALSRIGMEPQKEFLSGLVKLWLPDWNDETPGARDFSNVRTEYMLQFLEDARSKYGGGSVTGESWARQYAGNELGFSREQIEILVNNLKGGQHEIK